MQTIDTSATAITEAPMTAEEAREAVEQINTGAIFIRGKLLEIHRRKGWEALGYESWKEFAEGEFQSHRDTLYKMVEAAETEIRLIESGAEVSKIFDTPDSQLRVIQQAGGADLQVKAFNLLQSWKEEGSVSAKDAEAAVFTVDRNKRYNKAQKLVSDFIVANDDPENATAKDVLKWAEEEKGLTPRLADVLEEDVKVFVNQGRSEKAQNGKVAAAASNPAPPSPPKKDKSMEIASFLASYSYQEVASGLTAMPQSYWLQVVLLLLPRIDISEINEDDLPSITDAFYAAGEATDSAL